MPTSLTTTDRLAARRSVCLLSALALCVAGASGCITSGYGGITPSQMPEKWLAPSSAALRPVDLTLLRREPLVEHVVRAGDVVGVYVEGILSGENLLSGGAELPNYLLAPEGREQFVESPAIGQPILVQTDGQIALPQIGAVPVTGLTLQQSAEAIRSAYINSGVLKDDPSKSYVQFSLIRQRPNQVLVLREDAPVIAPAITRRDTYTIAAQGSGTAVELPADESDLLHALVETGGLPGEDASTNVWILRGAANDADWQAQTAAIAACPEGCQPAGANHTVIPLRVPCDQPVPFSRADVLLDDGDVVYVERRKEQVFYTGGLLQAGRIPIPRDEDVDVLEAIALANTGVGGPAGVNSSASLFRSGPGNVIPPTRATILRKLPGGQQIKIDVDLRKAQKHPNERVRIMPEDFVSLHYRSHELLGNIALNFVNVNYVIPNE